MVLIDALILPNFINAKVQLKDFEIDRTERLQNSTMIRFEILKLLKYKEEKEARIRSMADEYQNILPPHVYFWQLRIIECFEHSKIFQKS